MDPVGRDTAVERDAAPDVPTWAVAIGAVLVVLFVALSANAYFGGSLLGRLRTLRTAREPVAATGAIRAYYSPSETPAAGMESVGSRGHTRRLQAGEVALLAGSGRLVRLEPGGATELVADGGATVTVPNLGPWDQTTGRLVGQTAHLADGRWRIEKPSPSGFLSLDGLGEEELPASFALVPTPAAGRPRRMEDGDGVSLRIRAAEQHAFVGVQTHALATVPEGAVVTVWALVRAREDTTVGMRLTDIVDAAGTREEAVGRWSALKGWNMVTLPRRLAFQTPEDRFAIGLIDPRAGDWVDVRDVGVYLGVLP